MRIGNGRWHLMGGFAIGVTVFAAVFDLRILNPLEIGWVSADDMAQHFLGWHFFRHETWNWPPGLIANYAHGLQATIALTDSVPLAAFMLKPFSGLLPEYFNYLGLWVALSFGLQGLIAARILRQLGVSRWQAFLGASLICVVPFMMHRATLHIALASHWVLLAGISAYLDTARSSPLLRRWRALLPISALVHPYLLAMNLCLFAASTLLAVQRKDLPNSRIWISVIQALSLTLFVIYLEGYFSILGQDGAASGYGKLQMNLLAWINPHGLSQVLPSIPVAEVEQTDGLNYLGLGALLILAAAVLTLPFKRARAELPLSPLLLAALAMLAFAVSNRIAAGPIFLAEIPIPESLYRIGSLFRSSGRFGWTAGYLLLFGAIFLLARTWAKPLFLIVPFAALLNLYDTKPISERASSLVDVRGNREYPDCGRLPSSASKILFLPAVALEDQSIHQAWPMLLCAGAAGKPVNVGYLARRSWQRFDNNARAAESALLHAPEVDVLYVFRNPAVPAAMGIPDEAVGHFGDYFFFTVTATGRRAMNAADWADWKLRWNHTKEILLGVEGQGRQILLSGWDSPHWGAVLSKGERAKLLLPLATDSNEDLRIAFLVQGLPRERGDFDIPVTANGVALGLIHIDQARGATWRQVILPHTALPANDSALQLEFAIGASDDSSASLPSAQRQLWLSKLVVESISRDLVHIETRAGQHAEPYLESGWNNPESWGTWTQGNAASLRLPVPGGRPAPLRLRMLAHASGPDGKQEVTINIKDVQLARWRYPSLAADEWRELDIPQRLVDGQTLDVHIDVAWPAPPAIPGSQDRRLLGLGLSRLELIRTE